MGRKPKAEEKKLNYKLTTHVTGKKHQQLLTLLQQTGNSDMSTLIRNILENRPIKVFVHDETLDIWLEEQARLREEIRSIGVNINQITRLFNTYPEPDRKELYARMAFEEYKKVRPRIEAIFDIVNKSAVRWLQK